MKRETGKEKKDASSLEFEITTLFELKKSIGFTSAAIAGQVVPHGQ